MKSMRLIKYHEGESVPLDKEHQEKKCKELRYTHCLNPKSERAAHNRSKLESEKRSENPS